MGKVVAVDNIRVLQFDMEVALAIQIDGRRWSFKWQVETLTNQPNQINVKYDDLQLWPIDINI